MEKKAENQNSHPQKSRNLQDLKIRNGDELKSVIATIEACRGSIPCSLLD